jgi:hypothetical protein
MMMMMMMMMMILSVSCHLVCMCVYVCSATDYVECSSLSQIGLDEVFIAAVRGVHGDKKARSSTSTKQSKCIIS